jgi:hypothetical protein
MRFQTLKRACRSAAVLVITAMAVAAVRDAADRLFIGRFAVNWLAEIALSTLIAATWIVLYWVASSIHSTVARLTSRAQTSRVASVAFGLNLGKAFGLALVFAVALFLTLAISDDVFYSRLLPWDLPLIHMQYRGFVASNRFFPCRLEGSSMGCESYKTIPVFLAANALFYLPFLAAWIFLSKRFSRIEEIARAACRIYCPIAAVLGFLCLITTIVLWWLKWDFEFASPHSHIRRQVFEVISYSGGTIVVSAILLVTLLFLRLARSGEEEVLPEMTWLGCLLVSALHLGNTFLP